MTQRRNYLTDAEKSSRSEITIYSKYFNELKESLSIGADWTPDQQEQRSSLEKERDFLVSKLENKNSQVSGIRNDIDRIYQTVQVHEEEIAKADQGTTTITTAITTTITTINASTTNPTTIIKMLNKLQIK